MSYMTLASTFVVVGVRMLVEKPNKLPEIILLGSSRKGHNESLETSAVD